MKENKPKPLEILPFNNYKAGNIIIYDCLFLDSVKYRLRREKDNALIAEFNEDLDMLGDLKCIVLQKHLDEAVEMLNYHKKELLALRKKFKFDTILDELYKESNK